MDRNSFQERTGNGRYHLSKQRPEEKLNLGTRREWAFVGLVATAALLLSLKLGNPGVDASNARATAIFPSQPAGRVEW